MERRLWKQAAWYYQNPDGSMADGVTQEVDGTSHTFGNGGVWQP